MTLGRPLDAEERRVSQRNYGRFCLVNGASYMCLGENVLVLFAAQLGAPNAVVSLLGAMLYVGYVMVPLGVRRTAKRGAAVSQADFWVARNIAALFTASAAAVAAFSPPASWAMLILGAFVFYGCRDAGCVLATPLLGDISTQEEAPDLIGSAQAKFNVSAVVVLAAITAATTRWSGRGALAAIIVVGAFLGVASSTFLRGVRETGKVMESAREPLVPGMREAVGNRDLRLLSVAWGLANCGIMLLIPISMLALKRGCGFSDSRALVCSCVQFLSGCFFSVASGPLCRRFGPRRVLLATTAAMPFVPAFWFFAPSGGTAALAGGIVLFAWLGALNVLVGNVPQSYFLLACPDKRKQVAASVAVCLAYGAAAGVFSSVLGSWLVSGSASWSSGLGAAFAGSLGPFRLYFLLVLPVIAAAIVSAFRLRTLVYAYKEAHGESGLRTAIALGHHRKH